MIEAARITHKAACRTAILIVGATVFAVGLAMIVMPGPAFVVIPTGLAILGVEFSWARAWLGKFRKGISAQNAAHRNRRVESCRSGP